MKLSLAERDRRYQVLRKAMEDQGIDAIIVKGGGGAYGGPMPGSFRYFTDMNAHGEYVVFPREGNPVGLVSRRHPAEMLKGREWWVDLDTIHNRDKAGQKIGEVLKEKRIDQGVIGFAGLEKSLGRAEPNISHAVFRGVQETVGHDRLVDASDIVLNARTIKSDEEIQAMEESEKLSAEAIGYLCEIVRPGLTSNDLHTQMDSFLARHGADPHSHFSVRISFEPNADDPISGDKEVKQGHLLAVNTAVFIDGYGGHDRALVSVGEPSSKIREMTGVSQEALHSFLALLRPGATTEELNDAIESTIRRAGYKPGGSVNHFHPIGIEIPEMVGAAFQRGQGEYELQAGMVEAMQIFVGDPDSATLLELGPVYLVTEDGYRQLGSAPEAELVVV